MLETLCQSTCFTANHIQPDQLNMYARRNLKTNKKETDRIIIKFVISWWLNE